MKFKGLILAAVMLLQTVAASAAQISVNDATKEVTVSDLTGAAKVVAVDFLPTDDIDDVTDGVQTFASLSAAEKSAKLFERAVHLRQLTSNADYTFTLPAYGVYTVFVKDTGDSEAVAHEVTMPDPNFVTNHQGALLVGDLQTNLTNSQPYMRGELATYYALSPADKTAVANRVFARRAEDSSKDLIVKRVTQMSVLQNIINASGADKVTIFGANAALLNTALYTDIADYNALTDEAVKAQVVEKFAAYPEMDGENEFDAAFSEALFLVDIKNANTTQAVPQLVETAKTKFGVSTPGYDALGTSTTAADNAVMGTDYATVADFVTALETASSAPTPTPTQSGGGGGGGGGGVVDRENKGDTIVIEVPATPAPTEESEPTLEAIYSDVEIGRWSYEPIYILSKRGVISGDGGGIFRPTDSITREEFVKIAVSAFGLTDKSATCDFADVAKSAWSYEYIATAKKYGLVSGRTDTEFSPKTGITREEAAVIMYNLAKFKNIPIEMTKKEPGFADKDQINDWAKEAVTYLYRCSIIDGMSETEFAPKNNITREQTAKLVYTLLKVLS